MANVIVVKAEEIQSVVNKIAAIEQEIDNITTEVFLLKANAGESWRGEAREVFSENCHTLRKKGVEIIYHLQKDREKLQNATGILVNTEEKNKHSVQDLRADNIF